MEITPGGREEIDSLLAPMRDRLAEVDAGLSEEDRAVVQRYLTDVTEALRAQL